MCNPAAQAYGFGPPGYSIGHECRLARPGADVCYSGACLADWRRRLRDTYKTLDALNQAWGSSYKDFARIKPPSRREAKAKKQYGPWLDRVHEQTRVAFGWLEEAVAGIEGGPWFFGDQVSQADITTAVAWRFLQVKAAENAGAGPWPALTAFCERAEALPEFRACPLD